MARVLSGMAGTWFKMAGTDDNADAVKAHDLKEALSRSKTLHISCSCPYKFRQKEGRSEVSGIKPESDDIIHELPIQSWSSTESETNLLLSPHSVPIIEVMSILSKFCKQLKHLIVDAYRLDVSMHKIPAMSPSRMESVLKVSLSSMVGSLVFGDALAFTAWCFPHAVTLKVGRIILNSSSVSKIKTTLDLEELVLTLEEKPTPPLDCLLNTVSAACKKLKRFHIDSDRKFPLHTLSKMISQLACPKLEFLRLSQAKISLGNTVALKGVSWQKSSESCELILDTASTELPLMAVVRVVSRELKGVTVLSLNECNVKLPGKIGVPQRKLREETSIREINLFNMKDPIPESDMQALFTINVTLRDPSPHDGADMVHKYRSADEKPVEMPPPAKKRAHPSLAPGEPKRVRKLQLDPEEKLDKKQTSTTTPAHIHARKRERTSQEKQANGILASFTDRKAPSELKCERKLHCLPFVPQKIPEEPKCIILHVHLCDNVKGNMKRALADERKLGYMPSHAEMDVLIIPAKKNLKLKCRVNSSEQKKSLSYARISGLPHNCVSFEVNYKCKSDVVSLKVGQSIHLEVEFLFRIDVGDHQNTTDAFLPYEGQGTSTASPSSTRDTVRQDQAVTDQQITTLTELLSPNVYSKLCRKLGINYNLSCQIIKEHQGNYKAAYEDILHQWKDDTGGPLEHLDKALVSCHLGGLSSVLLKHGCTITHRLYSNFRIIH